MKKVTLPQPPSKDLLSIANTLNEEIAKMKRAKNHQSLNWVNWLYDCKMVKDAKAGNPKTELLSRYLCSCFSKFSTQFNELNRFELAVQDTGFYNVFNRPRGTKIAEEYSIHRNIFLRNGTDQEEKNIARLMRMKSRDNCVAFNTLGQVLNFEIPLGDNKQGRGNIDLVSYNGAGDIKKFYLLELKRPDSTESLLRCVLEIYTYFKTIANPKKMLADFGLPDSTKFVLAPLFFKRNGHTTSNLFDEFKDLNDNKKKTTWEHKLFRMISEDVSRTFADPAFNHLEFISLDDNDANIREVLEALEDKSLYR